jgi:NADPH:quinone reductase-like Zn-dependent oxidoreductase
VFHERKLEYLGVTVRACGYQPQGVPSLKGTPPPKNLVTSGFPAPRLAVKKIKPIVDSVFPLKDAAAAQRYLEAGKQLGKVVLGIVN